MKVSNRLLAFLLLAYVLEVAISLTPVLAVRPFEATPTRRAIHLRAAEKEPDGKDKIVMKGVFDFEAMGKGIWGETGIGALNPLRFLSKGKEPDTKEMSPPSEVEEREVKD